MNKILQKEASPQSENLDFSLAPRAAQEGQYVLDQLLHKVGNSYNG